MPNTSTSSGLTELPELLTPDEVAKLLRTSKGAIYVAVSRGQLPGVVKERGRLLFRRDEIRKYVGLEKDARRT